MPEVEMKDFVVYVGGPYRDKRGAYYIHQNILRALDVTRQLWAAGFPALCPHSNTALLDGAAPDEVWLKGYLGMLKRCDAIVVLPGSENSAGTQGEIAEAKQRGIPVLHWDDSTIDVLDAAAARWERMGYEYLISSGRLN